MNTEDRYINAVSARLIDSMAFSLLEVEGQEGLIALVRRRGQSLEFIFFVKDEVHLEFIGFSQIPRVKEYMNRLKCNRAIIVNVFPGREGSIYVPYMSQETYEEISISNLWVDIEKGTVQGDTSNLKRLEAVLKGYADIPRLERYTPFDLKAIQRVDVDAKPIITRGIIAVNILMWILMTLAGGSTNIGVLIRFGAMYSPLVLRGEYWRFVTPMFL
ncbi:MAG: rhomboid family intramembrane serine protease, partial [Bacillota bacterium]